MAVITKLKLKNFKSFRKAEIPFAEGFTAIAGANASGKSNILDALLFSMGITSLKQLRASRLTELVNHDSKEGYAKVELYVKNNEGTELEVTRIIDKQGKSIYKLDGKRKTLNEIQSLLLEMGINPNGHNIVVQGDITRIIEMNAKQRRQIIEEVAGLQEFEEKKEEAMKKLDKVEQKVKDANLVLNERETYLNELEKERENALKYRELQEESRRSKATIIGEEIKIIRKELDSAHKNLERMQKEITEKRSERDRLQDEERELEAKVEEATKKLIGASEETYESIGKETEQKKGHLNLLRERLESKSNSISYMADKIAGIKEREKEAREEREEKNAELKKATEALEKIREQLKKVADSVDAKNPGIEAKKKGIRGHEERHSELIKEIEGLRERLHEAKVERNGIEKDARNAEEHIRELNAREKRLSEKALRAKEIEKKIALLEKKSPSERLGAKEKEIEKISQEMHSAKGKIEAIEESLERLAKAKSKCPTCDTSLDEKHRESIISEKKKEASLLREKIGSLKGKREALEKEKGAIHAEERELASLRFEAKSFEGMLEELSEVKEKIGEAKKTISGKRTQEIAEEEKGLEGKLDALVKEKGIVEGKIREFRESSANTEMNELLSKMRELNEEKSAKEAIVTELRADIEKVISHKLEAMESEKKGLEKESKEAMEKAAEIEEEKKKTEAELGKLEAELEKANRQNRLLQEEKDRLTTKIKNISEKRDELGRKAEAMEKEMNETHLQQSRNEVRIVDLEEEFKEYSGVKPYAEFTLNDLKKRIPEIEREIEGLGAINMKALENFDAYKKEVDDVREKADKLEKERLAVVEMIDKIEVRKLNVFMECFEYVAKKFSELYYNFFEGEGHLSLSDRESPLEGGLLIQAKYKEDTMKSIDAMSGGEKSLTALAFLFAIQSFEPAPFYIFDEVDAALDKDNSIKVGKMIKGQSGQSQFISISHNDSVINQANQIIGVALNKQKSSVIGLRLGKSNISGAKERPAKESEEENPDEEGEYAKNEPKNPEN